MARPPLVLETWGKIRRTVVDGKHTAIAYYRDSDGVTRKMQRQGRTGADAERKLVEAMKDRLAPSSEDLGRDSRVSQAIKKWHTELAGRNLADGTVFRYKQNADNVITPGLGELRLGECTVPRVDRFLATISEKSGPGAAKLARVVLRAVLDIAVRHGALDANPVDGVAKPAPKKRAVTAPDLAVIKAVRARFAEWDAGKDKRGVPRTTDLLDPCDFLIGTGLRTGEVLAIGWDDLDLDSGVVTVSKTIATDENGKFVIQEATKTENGYRTLTLPPHLVGMLMARRVDAKSPLVFPSTVGTFRNPSNFRSRWREALMGTPNQGLTPKAFRRAVATVLRDELGVRAAQDQLGHSRESTTESHYIQLAHLGPAEAGAVLESLFA